MPTFATVEGYVNSFKEYPQNTYTKTLITVSSYREKDKEGKPVYDYIDLVHYNFGSRIFDNGDYITATGDIRSFKDQEGKTKNYINVKNVAVDPTKHREPRERAQNASSAPSGMQTPTGFNAPSRSNPTTFSAPRQSAPVQTPQKPPRDLGNPNPVNYETATGPELFNDENIPF